jgi:hypothetical protein
MPLVAPLLCSAKSLMTGWQSLAGAKLSAAPCGTLTHDPD